MSDKNFLETLKISFLQYLKTDARSNEKLKILHAQISKDLQKNLGKSYKIFSLGYEENKEAEIFGRLQ